MDQHGNQNALERKGKPRKTSKHNRRLLTQLDMAEIKRLESVHNSQANRGEKPKKHDGICSCGCGFETCAFTYNLATHERSTGN